MSILALHVTPATAQVAQLTQAVRAATGQCVDLASVDQELTGEAAAEAAEAHGIVLEVGMKLDEAKRDFVLLPRRWLAGRPFA